MKAATGWIGVDWGASRLRAWAFDARGAEIGSLRSDGGPDGPAAGDAEARLLALIAPWLDPARVTPVIVCGDVAAGQRWPGPPDRPVPCTPLAADAAIIAPMADPRISVTLLPGLSQARPRDVMRGAETAVAGFLATDRDFDGTLCLPGACTRWVQVSAGEVVSFRTAMTGALHAALVAQGLLGSTRAPDAGDDQAAGLEAVAEAMARPEALTARLGGLRAETLLDGCAPATASSRALGLLIGVDLAGARGYWLGTRLAVIGDGPLAGLYAAALSAQGVAVERAEAGEMVRAGLTAARAAMAGADPG